VIFSEETSDSKSSGRWKWSRDIQSFLCRHFCDKLPNLFSVYVAQRKGNHPGKAYKITGGMKSFYFVLWWSSAGFREAVLQDPHLLGPSLSTTMVAFILCAFALCGAK